jgi:tetratricopeptide (TPR) repeat protein
MTLHASLLRQLENPAFSLNQRAELRCQLMRELEDAGEYESAREALGTLWQGIGEQPQVKGLERSTAAEVLLCAGVLTGWLGSINQIQDSQESAKNLITESSRVFESLSYTKKILEAKTELAYCYWREGGYDEARIILQEVIDRLTTNSELKAKATLRLAIVEWTSLRYHDALCILSEAAPLFEKIRNETIRAAIMMRWQACWSTWVHPSIEKIIQIALLSSMPQPAITLNRPVTSVTLPTSRTIWAFFTFRSADTQRRMST